MRVTAIRTPDHSYPVRVRVSGGPTLEPGGTARTGPPNLAQASQIFLQGNLGLTFPHVNRLR